MKRIGVLLLSLMGSLAVAAVTGQKVEAFGVSKEAAHFEMWAQRPDALLTPELTHLGVQACLRKSQQSLDRRALGLAEDASHALAASVDGTQRDTIGIGLKALSGWLAEISTIRAETPDAYETGCRSVTGKVLAARRSDLAVLYEGRMSPKPVPALLKRGLEVVPLTWDTLTSQVCQLEGYYSDPTAPDLWKFFSLSRALSNVLTSDENDAAFRARIAQAPALVTALRRLDRYGAIAGKVNGSAIGESSAEAVRLTGPAAGSRATQMLATYTTGWRERLQWLTFQRAYPRKPFALLSSREVLSSLEFTSRDVGKRGFGQASQTEDGMSLLWHWMAGPSPVTFAYGNETGSYREAISLAWLALNAETNLRADEKIPGVKYSAAGDPTQKVFGDPRAYAGILHELARARAAFATVAQTADRLAPCLGELESFSREASAIPAGTVGEVSVGTAYSVSQLNFDPVYADIGLEVEDDRDGRFRLGLATGYGHTYPAEVGGQSYTLWSPSAFVLHQPEVVGTAQWKHGLVMRYDSLQ